MGKLCSIIIPTLNRPDVVERFVADIQRQEYPHKEIVIVDSSDEPNATLSAAPGVVYVRTTVRNTPHARNIGVRTSTGDVVVFFDDDMLLPDRTVLTMLMKAFEQFPYDGIAMAITDTNAALNKENQKAYSSRVMQVTRTGKVIPHAHGPEQDVTAPRGGGVAYRRAVVVGAGGFDERFVGNAMREETDFSLRLVRSGKRIRFLPNLTAIHLGVSSGGSRSADRIRWYRDFFANEFLFQLTHIQRIYLPIFFLRKLRPMLACMFYYGKASPRAWLAPFLGLRDGYRRFKQGFTPYGFSS